MCTTVVSICFFVLTTLMGSRSSAAMSKTAVHGHLFSTIPARFFASKEDALDAALKAVVWLAEALARSATAKK